MNKLAVGIVAGTCIVAIFWFGVQPAMLATQPAHNSKSQPLTQPPSKHSQGRATAEIQDDASITITEEHNDEAGFNFTPYVSEEMANEIRPYTSRSHEDLEVKVDKDGHEYVDLKKRWSHATISVIDENGEKHTGEWAPEN